MSIKSKVRVRTALQDIETGHFVKLFERKKTPHIILVPDLKDAHHFTNNDHAKMFVIENDDKLIDEIGKHYFIFYTFLRISDKRNLR